MMSQCLEKFLNVSINAERLFMRGKKNYGE